MENKLLMANIFNHDHLSRIPFFTKVQKCVKIKLENCCIEITFPFF